MNQRSIDILIDDKIIIELDGEGHYFHQSKEVNFETAFRNLHLLLVGYKMIVINIF